MTWYFYHQPKKVFNKTLIFWSNIAIIGPWQYISKKTKILIFQKKPRCQKHKYKFTLNNTLIENTKNDTYLGLTISASGNFNMAVNALKEKPSRAMYAIKMK